MSESTTTTKPGYTKPLPDLRPEGERFWAACREHRLILPADSAGKPFWYPRALTPGTLEPVQWIDAAGTGSVYTYSVHFIGPSKAYKGDPPHIVALIDLDEGVRMMSRVLGAPEAVRIGQRVRARIVVKEGRGVVVFDATAGQGEQA